MGVAGVAALAAGGALAPGALAVLFDRRYSYCSSEWSRHSVLDGAPHLYSSAMQARSRCSSTNMPVTYFFVVEALCSDMTPCRL